VSRSRIAVVALLLIGTALLGCGGKKKTSGPSLEDQYRTAMTEPNLAARTSQLLTVADKQRKAGDLLGMEQSLNSAAEAAKRMDDAKDKALALNRVAEAFGRAGRLAESKSLLREVSKAADQINEDEAKVTVLAKMAYTYGKHLNNQDLATSYLKNGEEIADGIPRPEGKIDALLEVALTCHELAMADNAKGLTDKSLAAARGLEDVRKRADAVTNAAATLSKMNRVNDAQATFQEAEKLIGEIPDAMSRAYAWLHLSDQLKASGRRPDAQKALKQAEAAADKVTDSSMRGPLLETIDRSRR
jgi:tetratricopeptide (TPR) repeat protein